MGCPDAVRAELLQIGGVLQVKYQADQDLFRVQFESVLVNLETIFAAVFMAGRKVGQEYFPEIVEEKLSGQT
jgi:copper chaperone CopZ